MLKLEIALLVCFLLVSGFGKPLEDADLHNEEVTDAKNVNDEAQRSGLTEDAKPLDADSSTKQVESRSADIKTVSEANEEFAEKTELTNIASEDARKGTSEFVEEASDSRFTSESRSLNTNIENVAEESYPGLTESADDEQRKSKSVEDKSRKREAEPVGVEGTRRILLGVSLSDEGDMTADLNIASSNAELRKSDEGASLEPEANVDEDIPSRTGNVNENGADLEETRRKNGGEKSEVHLKIDDSQSSQDPQQDIASTGERKDVDTTASLETRSAVPTTAEAETTPELRSGKDDSISNVEENAERSGASDYEENTRLNREDSFSKSATTDDQEIETADAALKSAKEALEVPEASESRSGAPTISAADDARSGTKLEETNADELSDIESRSGQSTVNAEGSSDGASEIAPELKSGDQSDLQVDASSGPSRRMQSDNQVKGSENSRTGLESEAGKEAVSSAGSPAEQSRLSSPSYTPLGFPTLIPVPTRRSIEPYPSIIVTKIPSRDIITLPSQLGNAINFLLPPNQQQRRHLEVQNEIDALENSYTFAGEGRAGENEASGTEAEVSLESEKPESLLRVDDYADDFNNYNLKSRLGSPAANPEARYSKPDTASLLASEAPLFDDAQGNGEESRSRAEPSKEFAEITPTEASRKDTEMRRVDATFNPNLRPQHQENPFKVAEAFLPRFSNYLRQADPFWPTAKSYLPQVESSLKVDSVWPKPLVNRLIQATSLANQQRNTQTNQFDLFYPYSLYYPSTPRYF